MPRRLQPGDRSPVLHRSSGRRGRACRRARPVAVGVDELERDCTVITPQAGQLIIFDGKTYPHYARALVSEPEIRVVAVMNFYTGACPESTRPQGLNTHLFGDE